MKVKVDLTSESATQVQIIKSRFKEVRAKLKTTIKDRNDALREKIKSNTQTLKDKLADSKANEKKAIEKAIGKKVPTKGKIGKARKSITKRPGRRTSD